MQVVLLTGPSGCGKSRLTRRAGLPTLALDEFYRDGDDPDLPKRFGIVDWDDPRSWHKDGALQAIGWLVKTGEALVPDYDMKSNSKVGSHLIDAAGAPLVFAEGVFAGELVAPLQRDGVLATAICLKRPRLLSFIFRLTRDIREGRKPIPTLIRRGFGLLREEPKLIRHWAAQGCQPMSFKQAEQKIAALQAQLASGSDN